MTSAELEVPIERIEESVKGILDLVSSGGSCILTQGGKPVARVVPINDETEDAWRLQSAEIEAAQEARPHNMQD
jgi:antitoxin (DNA-binding transcriptional repressor) of toxin-antitoxin stability system